MTQSGKRRIFCCNKCERPFSETRDTVFFDLRTPEEKVMMALKMLLVKVALSDIGFVLDVTEETVLEWLRRAAQKAHDINTHLLRDLPVTQVQLDEMWNVIRRTQALQAGPDGESIDWSEDGRQWVWISFAPEFRLILAVFVGPRTLASALQLIQMTAAVVLGVPCFFSDGFSGYLSALIEVYPTLKVSNLAKILRRNAILLTWSFFRSCRRLGGVCMIRLVLSPEEHIQLEQTRHTRPHLAERCHYVLLNAQGWSVPQIARRLDRNEHTIRTWLKAYRSAGLTGLHNTPQPGRPATLGQRVSAQIAQLLAHSPSHFGYI